MNTLLKIFSESGAGAEMRLEECINGFAARNGFDIVSAKPLILNGIFADTMFIVVIFSKMPLSEEREK